MAGLLPQAGRRIRTLAFISFSSPLLSPQPAREFKSGAVPTSGALRPVPPRAGAQRPRRAASGNRLV
jgi:hypothetical protein